MSRSNEITLFSNGIGHFRRVYELLDKEDTTISIPFKKENLDDVAASLQIFGKVRIVKQPAFTPSNSNATALKIDPGDAYISILRRTSGAKIIINRTISCTLFGISEEKSFANGVAVEKNYVVFQDESGIKKIATTEIESIFFEEEDVNSEIEKALKSNFQLIKPDSTMMDVTIRSLEDSPTEAVVQYTVPVASWKMRYAIRQNGSNFVLEGAAIIDNNTDENWDNFKISVVTGNPVSFRTDIASICVPPRKIVSLMDDSVLANVYQSDEDMIVNALRSNKNPVSSRKESLGYKMSSSLAAKGLGDQEDNFGGSVNYCGTMMVAEAAGVESKEVGDFCVFTSKELITILARKSAIVPMFSVTLKNAGTMLFYKKKNHYSRPFRAIKLKNETEYSLGKGKTVVYNEGVFSGECILEATKPGETKMLPHCLENGVKISHLQNAIKSERVGIRLSNGILFDESKTICEHEYHLENKKDELFKIAVDHELSAGLGVSVTSSGVKIIDQEILANGSVQRFYFELKPKENVKLVITETNTFKQELKIVDNFGHFYKSIICGEKIAENKEIRNCVGIQEELDAINDHLKEKTEAKEDAIERMETIRANLIAAKDFGQNTLINNWIKDLDEADKEVRNLDKVIIPELRNKISTLRKKLNTALGQMVIG